MSELCEYSNGKWNSSVVSAAMEPGEGDNYYGQLFQKGCLLFNNRSATVCEIFLFILLGPMSAQPGAQLNQSPQNLIGITIHC